MIFLLFCFGYFFTNNNTYNVVNHRKNLSSAKMLLITRVIPLCVGEIVNIAFEQCFEKPILRLLYIKFGNYSIFEIDLIL